MFRSHICKFQENNVSATLTACNYHIIIYGELYRMENEFISNEAFSLISKMQRTASKVLEYTAAREDVNLRKNKKRFATQEAELDKLDLTVTLDESVEYDFKKMLALYYNITLISRLVNNDVLRRRLVAILPKLTEYVNKRAEKLKEENENK